MDVLRDVLEKASPPSPVSAQRPVQAARCLEAHALYAQAAVRRGVMSMSDVARRDAMW